MGVFEVGVCVCVFECLRYSHRKFSPIVECYEHPSYFPPVARTALETMGSDPELLLAQVDSSFLSLPGDHSLTWSFLRIKIC